MRPVPANQVSVQPPLSQMRMGATLLMTRRGRGSERAMNFLPPNGAAVTLIASGGEGCQAVGPGGAGLLRVEEDGIDFCRKFFYDPLDDGGTIQIVY